MIKNKSISNCISCVCVAVYVAVCVAVCVAVSCIRKLCYIYGKTPTYVPRDLNINKKETYLWGGKKGPAVRG